MTGKSFDRAVADAWPFSAPTLMHTCGRDYQADDGPAWSLSKIDSASILPVHRIGNAPGWLDTGQIWSTTDPGLGTRPRPRGCDTVIFIKTGSDSFRPYELEGGP